MSAPRRALLVSLVAVSVFAALPTLATASSAFTTAWAAYCSRRSETDPGAV